MDYQSRSKKKAISSKARLINFYNRHHSNSPLLPIHPKPSQASNLCQKVVKDASPPSPVHVKQPESPDHQDSENYPTNENSPSSKLNSSSELNKLNKSLSERIKSLDKREADLKLKESELNTKESQLVEANQELLKTILKLNHKEKEL